jgi:hypothetical protein
VSEAPGGWKDAAQDRLHPGVNAVFDSREAVNGHSAGCGENEVFSFLGDFHEPWRGFVAKRIEQANGFRVQIDNVRLAVFGALLRNGPLASVKIDLAPSHARDLIPALARQKQRF